MTHEEISAIVWMICVFILIGETTKMLINEWKVSHAR